MNIIKHENVLAFMLGGKARFVLWNSKTDNRFEFAVTKAPTKDVWPVIHNKQYLGSIYRLPGHEDFRFKGEIMHKELQVYKSLIWYLNLLFNGIQFIPENIIVYHLGSCSVCGRELKDPVSIELGIGPICLSRLNSLKA